MAEPVGHGDGLGSVGGGGGDVGEEGSVERGGEFFEGSSGEGDVGEEAVVQEGAFEDEVDQEVEDVPDEEEAQRFGR